VTAYVRRPWLVLAALLVAHVGLSVLMEEHSPTVRAIGLVAFLAGLLLGVLGIAVIARSPAVGRVRYVWLAVFAVLGAMYLLLSHGHAPQLLLGALVVVGSLFAATIRRA
jgi:hypothetical protein